MLESQYFIAWVLETSSLHLIKKCRNVRSDGWKGLDPNPSEVKGMTPSKMAFALDTKCHVAVQTADTITTVPENNLFLIDTEDYLWCLKKNQNRKLNNNKEILLPSLLKLLNSIKRQERNLENETLKRKKRSISKFFERIKY